MIVYNVTIKVENRVLDEWLSWIEKHAPEVVATGCFESYSFFELLEPKQDDQRTFVVQYFAKKEEDYQRYISEFAPQLKQEGMEKFEDQFVAFRSKLEKLR